MKNKGKIALYATVTLILAVTAIIALVPEKAQAATHSSRTFVLPSSPSVTYDANTYLLIWDKNTGDLVATAGGSPAAATTWAEADIATAAHTNNTEVYTATIPALTTGYEYCITVWSGTNYSNADTFQSGPFLYDPDTGIVYTDTNPVRSGHVKTGG